MQQQVIRVAFIVQAVFLSYTPSHTGKNFPVSEPVGFFAVRLQIIKKFRLWLHVQVCLQNRPNFVKFMILLNIGQNNILCQENRVNSIKIILPVIMDAPDADVAGYPANLKADI
jgi:hypothetical protein